MASYNPAYYPPAPILEVVFIAQPHGAKSAASMGFLDTGADMTIAPKRLLQLLEARPLAFKYVRSYIGERRSVRTYAVDVVIDGITLPGIEVIGDDIREPLLGRDVLNRLRLVLDGPRQKIEVHA